MWSGADMTLDPKVEKKMVGAVMPWLKNFHHMRAADKESAVREALKYAIQIYELHRETAAPDLLECLKSALQIKEQNYGDGMRTHMELDSWANSARAVIAKASPT
jgi:hypothetical protein